LAWNYSQGQGEGDLFVFGQGGQGGLRVLNTDASAYPTFAELVNILGDGSATFSGTVATSQGELGPASGTWTPASGTLDVASGTTINIAAVPSAANRCIIYTQESSTYGYVVGGVYNDVTFGVTGVGTTNNGAFSTESAPPSIVLFDGAYFVYGFFTINGGYLQFQTNSDSGASTDPATSITWAVGS
jgi:hypothetical protein